MVSIITHVYTQASQTEMSSEARQKIQVRKTGGTGTLANWIECLSTSYKVK